MGLEKMPVPMECIFSVSEFVFLYQYAEAQGQRESMEDGHFYKESNEGIILGVLDGHGGKESKRAALGMRLAVEDYLLQEEKKKKQYGDRYKYRFTVLVEPKRFDLRTINVSRAIGDRDFCLLRNGVSAGVIQKPKITVHRFEKSDILLLACDGLKDYVDKGTIIKILKGSNSQKIAPSLVNYAIHKADSEDNVTVAALRIL